MPATRTTSKCWGGTGERLNLPACTGGSGGGASKATVGDLVFEHYMDRASPNLMLYCLTGKPIDKATLVMRKAGGTPLEYPTITMSQVIVTHVAPVFVSGMPLARETVSLSFARVKQDYVVQNAKGGSAGTISMGFDIKAHKEI